MTNKQELRESASAQREEFARDVLEGLGCRPKRLPSRWLYDQRGSELFNRIVEMPAYYPFAREAEIISRHAAEIADLCGRGPCSVIEFGSGDGRKTRPLLDALLAGGTSFAYHPVDVSAPALGQLCKRLQAHFGDWFDEAICRPFLGDNLEAARAIMREWPDERRLVLFLGSSIGNMMRDEQERFLGQLRAILNEGDLVLMGFDLVKDPTVLEAAYDDAGGLTREFNLNVLDRMNRELGANFARYRFRHVALWNPANEGMESWLVSLAEQRVRVEACGRDFHFRPWEGLLTEVSLKFRVDEITRLATRAGFRTMARYTDAAGEFLDVLWEAGSALH